MKDRFVFTSDSVTEGHPDKLCDRISDALVDAYLAEDPLSRINAECVAAKSVLLLAVNFSSAATVDAASVARRVIDQVGYRDGAFTGERCSILTSFSELPRPASLVDERELDEDGLDSLVAQQQVTLFGYACDQTPDALPFPIWLAHRLARRLDQVRHDGADVPLTPDGQSQVAVVYEDRRPARLHTLTINAATQEALADEDFENAIRDLVIAPVFEEQEIRPDRNTRLLVNPAGPVPEGGPMLHSGLTGRKTAIDTYGEYARHSASALSGKGPNRIDRIGAYAARHAARNVISAGLARECEVQLSYAIGLAEPVSFEVETFGTASVGDDVIADRLTAALDFRPGAILARFGLRDLVRANGGSFFEALAAYGHMGRSDMDAPWERTDVADALR